MRKVFCAASTIHPAGVSLGHAGMGKEKQAAKTQRPFSYKGEGPLGICQADVCTYNDWEDYRPGRTKAVTAIIR